MATSLRNQFTVKNTMTKDRERHKCVYSEVTKFEHKYCSLMTIETDNQTEILPISYVLVKTLIGLVNNIFSMISEQNQGKIIIGL